jgi:hypothetical protein
MARPALVDENVLRMALIGYEQERVKIEAAIANVRAQLVDGSRESNVTEDAAPTRRKMPAAARRRIAEAARKRWEAFRAAKAQAQKPAERPKRKMSAAGRKAIIEATRKRWAAYHKAQNATTGRAAQKSSKAA